MDDELEGTKCWQRPCGCYTRAATAPQEPRTVCAAHSVPRTVCRTRLRTPPAFSFSTYTAGWRPHSLPSLIRFTQRVEHCELCRALSWAALKEVHRKFHRCVCFHTTQCSGTCFCALHPFLSKVSLTIIVMPFCPHKHFVAWFREIVVFQFVTDLCGSWTWQCFPNTRRCPVCCVVTVWPVWRVVTVQGPLPPHMLLLHALGQCALLFTIAIFQSTTNIAFYKYVFCFYQG